MPSQLEDLHVFGMHTAAAKFLQGETQAAIHLLHYNLDRLKCWASHADGTKLEEVQQVVHNTTMTFRHLRQMLALQGASVSELRRCQLCLTHSGVADVALDVLMLQSVFGARTSDIDMCASPPHPVYEFAIPVACRAARSSPRPRIPRLQSLDVVTISLVQSSV